MSDVLEIFESKRNPNVGGGARKCGKNYYNLFQVKEFVVKLHVQYDGVYFTYLTVYDDTKTTERMR